MPTERDHPLSFAQERLWFLDRLVPGNAFYNIPVEYRIRGPLDSELLNRSLNEVARRHETLRASFASVEGRPVQSIASSAQLQLDVVDLRQLNAADRKAETHRMADRETGRPFDLAHGPLLRAKLVRLEPEEHLLLITMHHIISDGWSISVLLRELATIYDAFSRYRPSPLQDLAVQYSEFAARQRQRLSGTALEAQLEYWKRELAGASFVLDLPIDRPRPPIQTYAGETQSFFLPPELSTALKGLARRKRVTLFMLLLAALQTLLYRYTGQPDILVGTAVGNRTRPELERLIGLFVNSLVLRGRFTTATFADFLGQIRETSLRAYEHQELPFEKLVEELHPERDLSRNPLFQVMFTFQNVPPADIATSSLVWESMHADSRVARFDLTLVGWEERRGVFGVFQYNRDLFDAETVSRFAQHFRTLVAGVAADAEERIATLPILTGAERRRLIMEWNDTAAPYPDDILIHQLFDAAVQRVPHSAAVIAGPESLTYTELNERANRLAHQLRARGVGPEIRVGICLETSVDVVVGILAILKAGGAYIPLDPGLPAERLGVIIEDAEVRLVLTEQRIRPGLPSSCSTMLLSEMSLAGPATSPTAAVRPDNLAYVIYTSGSTGRPKGVMVSHRALCKSTWARMDYYGSRVDRFLLCSPIAFDSSVAGLFWTLTTGGTLVLPQQVTSDTVARALMSERISHVLLVPSLYAAVLDEVAGPRATHEASLVIVAGEECQPKLAQRHHSEMRGWRLFNEYGPTEATVWCTVMEVGAENEHRVAIGRPIANSRVYVLNENLEPVPIGIPGELHIGGLGLARGYVNLPDMTAEKFIPDPFGAESGARMYRTGDRARYRVDGAIEFLGRLDNQVKIRGHRVELGDIESALRDHDGIAEAVAVVAQGGGREGQIDAFVVAVDGVQLSASEVRGFLRDRLPKYMIPAALHVLESLPLNANGKLDRHALSASRPTEPEADTDFAVPQTSFERQLADIWEQLLGVERVGRTTNFFELGGHSLLAMQLVFRIREALGLDVPLRLVFEAPTIAELAAVLRPGDNGIADLVTKDEQGRHQLRKDGRVLRPRRETEP